MNKKMEKKFYEIPSVELIDVEVKTGVLMISQETGSTGMGGDGHDGEDGDVKGTVDWDW